MLRSAMYIGTKQFLLGRIGGRVAQSQSAWHSISAAALTSAY